MYGFFFFFFFHRGFRELNGQLKFDFPQHSGIEVMHEEERLLSGQHSTQKSHFI